MKQQTVIEWLIDELKGYEYDGNDFIFNGVITSELIEEVKEMEKEQIQLAKKESYNDGWLEATQYIFKKYKEQEDGR